MGQGDSSVPSHRWLDGLEEQRQRTDVHYRSLQGDGAFNWRFVFSFQCVAAEERCILPHKARDTAGCGCQGGGDTGDKGDTPIFPPRSISGAWTPRCERCPPSSSSKCGTMTSFRLMIFWVRRPVSPQPVSPHR